MSENVNDINKDQEEDQKCCIIRCCNRQRNQGTIIPLATGNSQISLDAIEGGRRGNIGLLAFGSADTMEDESEPIYTHGSNQYAFTLPRDGKLTGMYFHATNDSTIFAGKGDFFNIYAQLYEANIDTNSFAPIKGAEVKFFPTITERVDFGTVFSGKTTGLAIPLTAGTQLLMVLYVKGDGSPKYGVGLTLNANGGYVID